MIKKLLHRTCLLIFFTLISHTSPYAAHADEISFVSNFWLPYNGTPNSPQPGYVIEIAEYALAKEGHSLKYQLWSWDKSIKMVREGSRDCLIGDLRSQMSDFIYPKSHIGADQKVFLRPKGSEWLYKDPDSLNNIKLGTIYGYTYSQDVKAFITDPVNADNLTNTKGKFALEFNLMSLIAGKIDAVVDSKNVLYTTLKKHGWDEEVELAGNLSGINKVHIACSPANPKSKNYVDLIDKGLQELRRSGQLAEILQRYNMQDWQQLPATDN